MDMDTMMNDDQIRAMDMDIMTNIQDTSNGYGQMGMMITRDARVMAMNMMITRVTRAMDIDMMITSKHSCLYHLFTQFHLYHFMSSQNGSVRVKDYFLQKQLNHIFYILWLKKVSYDS